MFDGGDLVGSGSLADSSSIAAGDLRAMIQRFNRPEWTSRDSESATSFERLSQRRSACRSAPRHSRRFASCPRPLLSSRCVELRNVSAYLYGGGHLLELEARVLSGATRDWSQMDRSGPHGVAIVRAGPSAANDHERSGSVRLSARKIGGPARGTRATPDVSNPCFPNRLGEIVSDETCFAWLVGSARKGRASGYVDQRPMGGGAVTFTHSRSDWRSFTC